MLTNSIRIARAFIASQLLKWRKYLEYEHTHKPTPRENFEMFCALMLIIIIFLIADVTGR